MAARILVDGVPCDGLAFGSGSLRVVAFLGPMSHIETGLGGMAVRACIRAYAGISAGAMLAVAFAAGARVRDVAEVVQRLSDRVWEPDMRTLLTHGALDLGKALRSALADELRRLQIDPDETVGTVEARLGVTIRLYTARTSHRSLEAASPETSIIDAIVRSSAVPYVFAPVHGPDGECYVDGGLLEHRLCAALTADAFHISRWLVMRVDHTDVVHVTQGEGYHAAVMAVLLSAASDLGGRGAGEHDHGHAVLWVPSPHGLPALLPHARAEDVRESCALAVRAPMNARIEVRPERAEESTTDACQSHESAIGVHLE